MSRKHHARTAHASCAAANIAAVPGPPSHDSLQLEQDLQFTRKTWRVQRVGWVLLAALIGAALAGIFGTGPVSEVRSADAKGVLSVEYARFVRYDTLTVLKLDYSAQAVHDGEVRLWLDRRYVGKVTVRAIEPRPSRVEAAGDKLVYVFAAPGTPSAGTVSFSLQLAQWGGVSGRAGTGDAEAAFHQVVYP